MLPATKKYCHDYQITALKKKIIGQWAYGKKCTVFKYNQIFILNNILQTNKQVVNCTILKHDIVEKKKHVCTMEFFYDGCHRNL